mmetsp:Transcript_17402/g.17488  ORF Transcript_17402/g.17488 Transcript_17402/m.17488 type:complete len:764 (+) Transcript_17402:55-2346(+)
MSLLRFTLDSDDEIESEGVTDDEVEITRSSENVLEPNFIFEDGELPRRYDKKEKILTNDDLTTKDLSETEETKDCIRDMPHAEERALRAQERKKFNKEDEDNSDDGMDPETEAEFFDSVVDASGSKDITFYELNLSRPLLRAIEAAGFITPTPVQAQVIPIALAGRDVCASAATGSGKTAAFVLPFLERLLYRPRDTAEIRVLVVTPTRELATQINEVLKKLSQFTDVTYGLICGGKKDLRSQETLLRKRPDIVVCTPGRIIDHLRNSQSVSIRELDVLVLDEADRLLELGFQSELEELLRHCPYNRQTMLFSATMTSKVDDLACLSLRKPIRVKTSGNNRTVAPRLIQEFVKVRNEEEREAMLTSLICKSGFNSRVIVFFETKVAVHRFYLLLKLLKVAVGELHGDMTQAMRDLSLRQFREKETEVLVATDVAARGIDIPNIRTIINSEMPRSASTYVHRVGRTARAGSGGRAITLVSDGRRKIMREILKGEGSELSGEGGKVLSRMIPRAAITSYTSKIASVEEQLITLAREEKMKKGLDEAQREVEHAENMLLHEAEITSRPVRTWYQSNAEKKELQNVMRLKAKEEEEAAKEPIKSKPIMTAQERAIQLARSDDYRDEEDTSDVKRVHRLTRKKRRRIEALKGEEEEGYNITAVAKRARAIAREKGKEEKNRLVQPDNKKRDFDAKLLRPKVAVGGYDQDLNEWSGGNDGGKKLSKKKQRLAAMKDKEFTEFDPSKKLRKGGKVGKASFKSKGKFKRRK